MRAMNKARAVDDEAAREAALDPSRSFIVQAPAGSGKTELLLQRYLALLARAAQPEAIMAMTFTRKAAGEIRTRVLAALREAAAPPPTDPWAASCWARARAVLTRDAERGWNLTAHPARMQVHTIDALCVLLMRRAPLALKLGAVPQMTERAERLYAEAARAELETPAGAEQAWGCLLDYLDNDAQRLVKLIADLLGRREQWLPHLLAGETAALRASLEAALAAAIELELATLQRLLADAARSLTPLLRHAAGNLARAEPTHALAVVLEYDALPPAKLEALRHWQAIADWLLTKKVALRRDMHTGHGFPSRGAENRVRKQAMGALLASLAAIPGLASALNFVRILPPPRYEEAAWTFIDALLAVLPRVAATLQWVFAQAGLIDFSEATLVALRALATSDAPSDLLLAFDTRIEHLLIDEFQDTSLAQDELIRRLSSGWTQGDGRTLFLVGDPMQSIYRFRDAQVSLFLDAQRRRRIGAVALEPLTLSRNFRSQEGLVEWVNRIFPALPSSRDDPARGAVAFKPAIATRDREGEPAVTLDLCPDRFGEAATVVARVHAALSTDARAIALLVRRRSDLAEILPALRGAGTAYAAVELDRLTERQVVLDLVSLAHALLQPDDRAAWLATLRAPWCGLTLPDLFVVAQACGEVPLCAALVGAQREAVLAQLSADGRVRFARFAAVIAPALARRGRVPVATMLRGAWLALGGPACVSEPIDVAAAERVFALLNEQALGADVPDWAAFVDALHGLYADPPSDAATRVSVMTLHRAKGLEFDIVIMPGLARPQRPDEAQLLLWRERESGLLLAPIRSREVGATAADPVYTYLRALAGAENEAELARLLYVGCTRAKQRLHLSASLGTVRAEGELRWRPPPRGSSLAALWPMLDSLITPPADPGERPRAHTPVVPLRLARLPLAWRLPRPPTLDVRPPEVATPGEQVKFDWVRETARRVGTVAHRLLRQIGEDGLDTWSVDRVAAQRGQVERELSTLGFTGAEVAAAADQVLAALQTTLADTRGRWLFADEHADAHSEWALTHWRDGAFVHSVLDRTFVTAEGMRWIVDFKLSRHEGGNIDRFLDNERERYRAQLEAYAAAMRVLDARPIRLGLYFPLLAGWREWAVPESEASTSRI